MNWKIDSESAKVISFIVLFFGVCILGIFEVVSSESFWVFIFGLWIGLFLDKTLSSQPKTSMEGEE